MENDEKQLGSCLKTIIDSVEKYLHELKS
ncbi:unnamed protein product, partial [Rotaria magnacalcarata]